MPNRALTREAEIELAWQQHEEPRFRASRMRGLVRERKERLSEAQNWRCCYCGAHMDGLANAPDSPTFEHVVPRSQGGTDDEDNLVIACRRCNNRRGSEPVSSQ